MANYWIKGEDGEEYGPATLTELAEWVRENRAGRGTPVRTDDSQAWLPFQQYAELAPLLTQQPKADSPFPGESGLLIAPVHLRLLAYVFDLFLLGIVADLVNLILPPAWRADLNNMVRRIMEGQPPLPSEIWFALGAMALYILYFTLCHGHNGQTLGKKLFHVRVVDANGLSIGYWKAFVRAIGSLVSQVPYYAGFFLAFITPYRRTLHDWIAKTYVVRQP